MDDLVIGIDLGTTKLCAACYRNGKVEILENKENQRMTPSFIFFTCQDGILVGEHANTMAKMKPEYGVYEIKRLVGRKFDDPDVQKNLQYFSFQVENHSSNPLIVIEQPNRTLRKSPLELCTIVLQKIKENAEAKLEQPINKAVITVPAYFNMSQREVTLAAAKKVGFTVLKLLNEPTAAALNYYFENNTLDNNYSLVYDLGGGTFDVAILKRVSSNKIDIVCVDGDTNLGGHDFNNLIVDHVSDEVMMKYNYNLKSNKKDMRRLQTKCEEAKKALSVVEETIITLHAFVENHDKIHVDLTREQFENMTTSIFKKTIDIIDNCLKSANISKTDIKEVILSGGSTRIPKIQNMISHYFNGKTLNRFVNPDECVAKGAALQAAILSNHPEQDINKILLTDVTPLSLGIDDFVDVMSFMIRRNTTIPTSASTTRVSVDDQQKSVAFNIYEGERINVKKNRFLGTIMVLDVTPAPPGQCEVTITFNIDQDGILTIEAKEKYRDNVSQLKIEYVRGDKRDSEVKNTLKDAEDNKEEDERFRRFAYAKEYLINYCTRVMYNLEKKKLRNSHEKIYGRCESMKTKAGDLSVDDNDELNKMIYQIKQECKTVVNKNKFEIMPTIRSD